MALAEADNSNEIQGGWHQSSYKTCPNEGLEAPSNLDDRKETFRDIRRLLLVLKRGLVN